MGKNRNLLETGKQKSDRLELMSTNKLSKKGSSMPNSSTSLSYPKRPVLQNIIVLSFEPDSYQSLILSAKSFRSFLQQQFLDSPELFPPSFAQGFQIKDLYFSEKLKLYFRCIRIASIAYQVRPSFVTPYFTTLTDDVSHALFLVSLLFLIGLSLTSLAKMKCSGIALTWKKLYPVLFNPLFFACVFEAEKSGDKTDEKAV
jgi:hypothetical protein